MSWRQNISTWSVDILRALFQAILLFDAIVIGLFSAWFCIRSALKLVDWLGRTLFS